MTQRNLKITCSWNGRGFSGFQIQPHSHTVEETLTKAWKILDPAVKPRDDMNESNSSALSSRGLTAGSRIFGCSRLDAGVHAYQFVFNVFSDTKLSNERIVKSLNGILHDQFKADICIYSCEDVPGTFHARFSAVGKHYQYKIWHGFSEHQFYRNFAWNIKTKKSLEKLEPILKLFEGTHNFNSFRAKDCGAKNTTKTIHKITVKQDAEFPELYVIDIIGTGFLKNMIRNIVGMAMLVINEKKDISEIEERLESGKHGYNLCAPSHALTLMKIFYEPDS